MKKASGGAKSVKIPLGLACKLSSVAVHAAEMIAAAGHPLDAAALRSALADPEVQAWLASMTRMGLAPVRRT